MPARGRRVEYALRVLPVPARLRNEVLGRAFCRVPPRLVLVLGRAEVLHSRAVVRGRAVGRKDVEYGRCALEEVRGRKDRVAVGRANRVGVLDRLVLGRAERGLVVRDGARRAVGRAECRELPRAEGLPELR